MGNAQLIRFHLWISAQTSCNSGLGRVVYERLPDQQLQGFDDDVVSCIDQLAFSF